VPKGFTEHEKELIGERLREQAYKQFSTYGLRKTSVEELAAAAGISKGAFYNFYESKEALFMDAVEMAETRVRQELLAVIDLPGPTPRARLLAVLRKAFSLFTSIPVLQFFTGADFDLLFRRIPPKKLQEHLASDRVFFEELIARCQQAGIPIRAQTDQIAGLLYQLALVTMHQDGFGWNDFSGSIDLLLELVAAFCLGEIEIQAQSPVSSALQSQEG
jgi:AcrR family transcriptional regulator